MQDYDPLAGDLGQREIGRPFCGLTTYFGKPYINSIILDAIGRQIVGRTMSSPLRLFWPLTLRNVSPERLPKTRAKMRCHAACTMFSRCRAMPPRRRPPEQPAPTTSTRTFGQPRHSSSSSPRSRSPAHLDITQHRRTAQHSPADATCRATRSSCLTSHAPRKPEPSTTYPRPGSHTASRFPAR